MRSAGKPSFLVAALTISALLLIDAAFFWWALAGLWGPHSRWGG
jgi:hypothetical protein